MVRVRVSIRYCEETDSWRAFAPDIEGMEVAGTSLPNLLSTLHAMLEQHFSAPFDSSTEVASSSTSMVIEVPATVEKEAVE